MYDNSHLSYETYCCEMLVGHIPILMHPWNHGWVNIRSASIDQLEEISTNRAEKDHRTNIPTKQSFLTVMSSQTNNILVLEWQSFDTYEDITYYVPGGGRKQSNLIMFFPLMTHTLHTELSTHIMNPLTSVYKLQVIEGLYHKLINHVCWKCPSVYLLCCSAHHSSRSTTL